LERTQVIFQDIPSYTITIIVQLQLEVRGGGMVGQLKRNRKQMVAIS